MLEIFVVVATAVAAIGAAAAAALRHRHRRLQGAEEIKALPAGRRTEEGDLKVGDVVTYLEVAYLLEGIAVLDEGAGPSLVLARAEGDQATKYLLVEPGKEVAPVIADLRDPLGSAGALPGALSLEGFDWTLARRGSARVTVTGELEALAEGPVSFGRYEGPGGRLGYLLLAKGVELLLTGKSVTTEGLTLLQGGDTQ